MKRNVLAAVFSCVLAGTPLCFAAASEGSTALLVKHQHGIAYVSGGFGVEERERLAVMASDDNVQLSFALKSGDYLGGAQVVIKDQSGKEILSADANGPLFFAKLPAGTYKVDASTMGKTLEQTIHAPARGRTQAFFVWDEPSAASSHAMAK